MPQANLPLDDCQPCGTSTAALQPEDNQEGARLASARRACTPAMPLGPLRPLCTPSGSPRPEQAQKLQHLGHTHVPMHAPLLARCGTPPQQHWPRLHTALLGWPKWGPRVCTGTASQPRRLLPGATAVFAQTPLPFPTGAEHGGMTPSPCGHWFPAYWSDLRGAF